MRTKVEIKYPNGHPYILYMVSNKKARKYVASATAVRAKSNAKLAKAKAVPANILGLIKEYGYKETNKIISQFNPRWICKDGKIFYDKIT